MLHEHVQRVEAVLDGVTPSPVAQHRQRLALDQPTVGDARQVDSRPKLQSWRGVRVGLAALDLQAHRPTALKELGARLGGVCS